MTSCKKGRGQHFFVTTHPFSRDRGKVKKNVHLTESKFMIVTRSAKKDICVTHIFFLNRQIMQD